MNYIFRNRNLISKKLTLLLLVSFNTDVFASEYGQKVNLNVRNTSIEKVFEAINKQTNHRFVYAGKVIRQHAVPVSVAIKDENIDQALRMIFKNQNLEYEIGPETVMVKEKKATDGVQVVDVQQKQVVGTVKDANGAPIVGVSVTVKGTNRGTTSNDLGTFSIAANTGETLVFSSVGFAGQEVRIANQSNLNIVLAADQAAIDEVVVVGYGTAKKKDLTGSVARANIEAFKESPNVSILQSLQGALPGLNVGAVTKAGQDPDIMVRGRTSISGSNSPLIVLDGIIYRGNLVDLNPNDVASVNVLKDASAAAIYGSQASNGVILITSKLGTAGAKKTKVAYDFSYSLQDIANRDMLPENGAGFIRKIGDRFLTESRMGDDLLTPNPKWDPTSKFFGPEILKGYQDHVETDWWKLLTRKNPAIQNHSVSLTGNGDVSSYFMSFGYTAQDNVVINDSYDRYNFRINLDTKVTDWMKVGVQSFLSTNDYSGVSPSIGSIIGLPPQVPYLDENGAYIREPYRGGLNPFLQMDQEDLEKRKNLFGNIYAEIQVPFVKGLSYKINYSQNVIDSKHYNFNSYAQNYTGEGYKTNESQNVVSVDNILNYQNTFGDHAVTGTFVYGMEEREFENTTARSIKYLNGVLGYNKLDAGQAGLQTVRSSAWEESSLYAMVRLGYTYKDKYIFSGTVRRDGFSGFGPSHKFGTFPSAALAWRMSEEQFMKDLNFLDDLKVRASYGLNGNRTIGRYQTLSKIESSADNGYLYGDGATAEGGQRISSLSNLDLKWESTRSLNFGLDFSFFDNRISGTADMYWANTYDLLYDIEIPRLNGFDKTPMNIGKLNNSGQELSINVIPVRNDNFTWNATLNFSRNRNKVVSILGIDANGDGREDDLTSSKIFMGHPYGVAYDYNITGMWQVDDYRAGNIPAGFTYGTYKVEDINADGKYTAADDRKILGYTDPSYRFSILNTFQYKEWDFKFFINSIQGGKNYYMAQPGSTLANPDNIYGSNLFNFDYWTPENPDARYRQLGYYTVALGESFSPYVQRSFVRLQDVTLGYKIPKAILDKLKINQAKVFINGKNLLTFTDWDGWDPETGTGLDAGAYPVLKSYSIGINLQF